jgi:hypothetical protein
MQAWDFYLRKTAKLISIETYAPTLLRIKHLGIKTSRFYQRLSPKCFIPRPPKVLYAGCALRTTATIYNSKINRAK